MSKPISKQEFLLYKNLPIKYIGIYEPYQIFDASLLDCEGIIAAFENKTYLIKSKETKEEVYEFFYYEFNQDYDCRKIITTPEEALFFICEEEDAFNATLRFHLGSRPILATADDDNVVTFGLSHWDQSGYWLDYDNNTLFDDID